MTRILKETFILFLSSYLTGIFNFVPFEIDITRTEHLSPMSCCCKEKSEKECSCKSACCPMPEQSSNSDIGITYSACGSSAESAVQMAIYKFVTNFSDNELHFPEEEDRYERGRSYHISEYQSQIDKPPPSLSIL